MPRAISLLLLLACAPERAKVCEVQYDLACGPAAEVGVDCGSETCCVCFETEPRCEEDPDAP